MGAVFSASNRNTGKRVAIKWMHPEVAEDPDARERFMREAQASARVDHPNVVDVYDVLEEGDSLFLVMEYLEGEALADLMNRDGVPITELISLLLLAMRGVAAAHRQGIVHRDIKPENILLARVGDEPRPVPKVLDFGISKLSGTEEASLTKTGMALGTPIYMSIEQLSGVRDIDARTDIYAFGVILYQAVTGQAPYAADSFAVLIAKIMTEQAPTARQVRPEIPAGLSRVIEWAMAKDRQQRIPTMEVLIRELEPFASAASFHSDMITSRRDIPRVATPGGIGVASTGGETNPFNPPSETNPFGPPSERPTSAMPAISPPRGMVAAQARLPREATVYTGTSRTRVPRERWIAIAVALMTVVVGVEIWWLLREPTVNAPPPAAHVVVPAEPLIAAPIAAPPEPTPPPPAAVEAPPPPTPRPRPPVTATTPVAHVEPKAPRTSALAEPKVPRVSTRIAPTSPPTTTPRTSTHVGPRLRAGAPRSEDF